jgi:heme/copper-type cytochrome/quinol oxidase subunit 2
MRVPVLLAVFALLVGVVAARRISVAQTPDANIQVVEMTAKKYEFSPSPIHVKKGMKVQLKIKALDRAHGLKINVYPDGADTKGAPGLTFAAAQDCWKLEKGEVTTIEFVAQQPGSYPFRCCTFCGFGHLGMKGQLIVDP